MTTTPPLWFRLRNHPSLFCLHFHPAQVDALLCELANEIEARGERGLDRDPGETADWLRLEAAIAEDAAVRNAIREASA